MEREEHRRLWTNSASLESLSQRVITANAIWPASIQASHRTSAALSREALGSAFHAWTLDEWNSFMRAPACNDDAVALALDDSEVSVGCVVSLGGRLSLLLSVA